VIGNHVIYGSANPQSVQSSRAAWVYNPHTLLLYCKSHVQMQCLDQEQDSSDGYSPSTILRRQLIYTAHDFPMLFATPGGSWRWELVELGIYRVGWCSRPGLDYLEFVPLFRSSEPLTSSPREEATRTLTTMSGKKIPEWTDPGSLERVLSWIPQDLPREPSGIQSEGLYYPVSDPQSSFETELLELLDISDSPNVSSTTSEDGSTDSGATLQSCSSQDLPDVESPGSAGIPWEDKPTCIPSPEKDPSGGTGTTSKSAASWTTLMGHKCPSGGCSSCGIGTHRRLRRRAACSPYGSTSGGSQATLSQLYGTTIERTSPPCVGGSPTGTNGSKKGPALTRTKSVHGSESTALEESS